MELFSWRTLLCFALIASRIQDAAQLVIKNLIVPSVVRSGEVDHIILDCDYDLEKTPIRGLVVQWYVNEIDLLYQWIHKDEPKATELVAKYIDLSYKATNDSETMYRAMKLKNPGFELSGNYTCVVSTHADEKRDVRSMLIYRTEDKFELIHKKKKSKSGEIEVVTCFAEGVYPRPTLDINVEGISRPEQNYVVREDDGRYAATAVMEVKKDLIPDPAVITCVLEIPNTGYNVSRKSVVYRGPPTTTPATTTTLQRKMDILALDNAQPDTDNGGASGTSSTPSRLLVLVIVGGAVFRTFLY